MSRFMWWAPWTTTQPWRPRIFRGSDEWHNRSVAIVVPMLGTFIVFVGPMDRSGDPHLFALGPGGWVGQDASGCGECRWIKANT